jgi:hypothetical protein
VADFVAVIRRAVDGLSTNTPEMREKVYEKARAAVLRQLENMLPPPPKDMLQRQLDKLDDAISEVESAFEEADDQPPTDDLGPLLPHIIPRQISGLSFGPTSSGKLGILANDIATDQDLLEIGGLRAALAEAVDDLVALTENSNAYGSLALLGKRYRSALYGSNGELVVDRLYAAGIRLENASALIQKDVQTSDFPEMAMPVAEALDSILALHGPAIMSTALGRNLVARARDYEINIDVEERYRETALILWRETSSQRRLLEPGDIQEVIDINAGINEGRKPHHATQFAHATNTNLLATAAKILLPIGASAATAIAMKGFENSSLAIVTASEITALIDQSTHFFRANQELLRTLSAVAGGELSWLDPFLRWLESKRR